MRTRLEGRDRLEGPLSYPTPPRRRTCDGQGKEGKMKTGRLFSTTFILQSKTFQTHQNMANISSALNTAFKSIVEDNISALAVHVASELAGSKGKVTEEAVRKAIESFVVPADGAAKAKGKAVFASLSGPVTTR